MTQKINWYSWLNLMFKEFIGETIAKPQYEIVDIYECKKTGLSKAVIKLSERHAIEKNIDDILVDNEFLEGLDRKTIRTLTYIATMEHLKPDYSMVIQYMADEVDNHILELRSKRSRKTIKKSPIELSKDINLLSKINSIEANRIGYLAGVAETVKEYNLFRTKI